MGRSNNKKKLYLTVDYRQSLIASIFKKNRWTAESFGAEIKKIVAEYKDVGGHKQIFEDFCESDDRHLARILGMTQQDFSIQQDYVIVLQKVFPSTFSITTNRFTILPEVKSTSKILKKEPSHKIFADKPSHKKYHDIIKISKSSIGKTHCYEDALVLLIEQFHQSSNRSATIITSDLSFIFKIAPTLALFLKKGKKLCFLIDPKHGYSLLAGKELPMLLNLNVAIKVLDIKDTFQHHGVFFNYFEPESENIDIAEINFYEFRNSLFDHQAFISKIDGSIDHDNAVLVKILEKIAKKKTNAVELSSYAQKEFEVIEKASYTEWIKLSFTNADNLSYYNPPIYSRAILKDNENITFKIVTIPLDKIYYRTTRIVAYKAFQAELMIKNDKDFCLIKNGTAFFNAVNLFEQNEVSYFPINIPFVEYNSAEDRYEIAEGHSRLFALSLNPEVKSVQVVLVENIPQYCFEISQEFLNIDSVIKNTWGDMPVTREYFNEPNICRYTRSIESATHSFSNSSYQEIGSILVNSGILTSDEAVKYSRGKYKAK